MNILKKTEKYNQFPNITLNIAILFLVVAININKKHQICIKRKLMLEYIY